MFKYQPFSFVKEGMSLDEKYKVLAFNRHILADGVKDIEILDVRKPSRGERLEYEQFAPYGSMLSNVEVYANGAMNIYVRSKLLIYVIGVITVRPTEAYNAEKEYKVLDFKKEKS